jgi:chloramphenicol-sensitive protein RarD
VQWTSVLIAAAGVLWLTFNYGSFPWIALALAGSFGLYGLVRKIAAVPPVRGLGVESLYLFIPALCVLFWGEWHGQGGFLASQTAGGWGPLAGLLLVLGGALTAIPLIAFADAVRRIPFSVVGLMQYIAPTLQLLCGVLIFGEPFGRERMLGFALIWLALAIFATDGIRRSRRRPA